MANTFPFSFPFAFCVFALSLVIFTAGQLTQYRVYECSTKLSSIDCKLIFFDDQGEEEWNAINDNGCFLEYSATQRKVVEYCPLQCPEADDASIIHLKSENPECSKSSSVEQRATDWFLLRSGDCIKQEINYRVRCSYHNLKKEKKIEPKDSPSGAIEMKPEFQVPEGEEMAILKMEETINLNSEEGERGDGNEQNGQNDSDSVTGNEIDRKTRQEDIENVEILTGNKVEEQKEKQKESEVKEELQKKDKIEDIQEEDDDTLPMQVDSLLSIMFPAYKKTKP
ncbi:hypothetical protein WR25_04458 [Diploscapter pachys]|uniref:DUF7808 domain-containing protein n=1 Tax=Diploscapter pachys TaxID=2018661 RepID=A0A2A2LYS0_9BILA|nr:hypothetical protein WR25_04458 [Diploscapter pachys]